MRNMRVQKLKLQTARMYKRIRAARLETVFAVIFAFFGIIFALMIPPGWNTDELDHTYRIHQLSAGNLLSEEVGAPNGLKAFGGEVPTQLVRLYDLTGVRAPGAATDRTVKVDELYEKHPEILTLKDDGERTSMNFSGAALYSPVAYAVYVPVFWLGQLFSLPFFSIILLCKLVGLLMMGAAFFFAIRHAPVGKWLFFATGLLPVVVGQAVSVGADMPQIAISVVFVALVLRLLYLSTPPKAADYGVITVLGAALVLIKLVYAPLVLLVLALPVIRKAWRSRKHILLVLMSVVGAIVPGIIWLNLVSYIDINSNPQANFDLQKAFIIHEPVLYLKTLYYTFFTNEQPLALAHIFGNFIWASAPLAAVYAYIASAALICSLFVRDSREVVQGLSIRDRRIWRGFLVIVSFIIATLIATALYVYSTTLQQSSIVGIQARYFIPILPVILLIFYGNMVKNQRIMKMSIIVMSCVVLLGSVLTVYYRMYQTLPTILQ
jgi:uncharacterized membrane protein